MSVFSKLDSADSENVGFDAQLAGEELCTGSKAATSRRRV